MIIVTGTVTVSSAQALEGLRDAMRAQIAASRAEKGCIEYTYGIDVVEPNKFRVLEYWESRADLDVHLQAPHMATWKAALQRAGVTGRELMVADAENATSL